MKLKNLNPNPKNPRTISGAKLAMLKKAIKEFGDLSGVVYNRKTKQLVGSHQRLKTYDPDTDIVILKKHSKPTATGTVAEGYFEVRGERFSYREVWWDLPKEKAANIAANKGAGDWDYAQLNEWLKDLNNFDLNFDISLTMFDMKELSELPSPIEVAGYTRDPGQSKEDEGTPPGPAKCKSGEVYALGETRLKCGEDDLHYCDLIISRWEKYSGKEAILMPKTQIKKKPVSQAASRAHG